jgi:hypothetical protein
MHQPAVQKREFRLDKHAITTLIQAQAGSLEKALLEAVANAIDAGASKVEVNVSPTHVSIVDDGRGFASVEEIDRFFDTFGFDHSQLDRKVGRFGVGRGQLFHFGKNLWTTHGHTMAVDSKTDGFGYDLSTTDKPHKGVKIEIELYQALSFSDVAALDTNFKKLVKYSTIPVIYNGKEIQKSPEKVEWDSQTDDAWFKFDEGYELKIYSQGLFVQSISSHRYGKGGKVVTKMGHALAQNLARNDLLTTDCPIWKRVSKEITRLASGHQAKAKSGKGPMTEAMRASLSTRALHETSDEAFEILCKTPLFTLTNGKHVRLEYLLSAGYVACANTNDPAADLLIQRKQAMVVSRATLHRFGASSMAHLMGSLRTTLGRHADEHRKQTSTRPRLTDVNEYEARRLKSNMLYSLGNDIKVCKVFEKVSELPMRANTKLTEVKPSEYSSEEKQLMSQLRTSTFPWISRIVANHLDNEKGRDSSLAPRSTRTLALASSEAFLACTDGSSKVWIDRKYLRRCASEGVQGFTALANTLVHELLHDVDTSTGHGHDHAFYEAYHDLTVKGTFGAIALNEYRAFLRKGGKAGVGNIKFMEATQSFEADDVQSRLAALPNGGDFEEIEPVQEAPQRAPRRKMR